MPDLFDWLSIFGILYCFLNPVSEFMRSGKVFESMLRCYDRWQILVEHSSPHMLLEGFYNNLISYNGHKIIVLMISVVTG